MRYTFTAKDAEGHVKTGTVDALDRDLAASILQRNGWVPVSVERETSGFSIEREIHKILDRVTQKELMIFFRQLSTLIEARVPVVSSLQAIAEQADNRYLQMVIKEVADDLEDGMSFSEALGRFPTVFSPLIVNMVRSGEVSGNLQKSVTFIADNIERNYLLTARVKGALFYPGFVVSVAIIIGFIVISFILPKLTVMIKDLGVEVPWYTQIMMSVGDFMNAYWWAVALIILGFIGGLLFYARTDDGQKEWNYLQLKLPVIGTLLRYVYISRFADNLSALLASGIPVVRALHIVSDVVGNVVYQSVILRAADEVKTGKTISSVFSRSPEIPPIVSRMIAIGEETGKMNHVLDSTSRFYSQEVDNMTRNLTSLLEPVLIVILGIGVGILVVSVIMPIYNITGSIQ
ncbi:MAG: type II secretion system F family protein [Candidatus Moraniibacteriota bacterium]|nr:MAG: type II secretion system F family protein [Candidatus Moranbacteria bacterium]